MAIRLRRIDGILIALCAARSVHLNGDIYLDDEVHHALTSKFSQDFNSEGFGDIPEDLEQNTLREQGESCNSARVWWDSVYGKYN